MHSYRTLSLRPAVLHPRTDSLSRCPELLYVWPFPHRVDPVGIPGTALRLSIQKETGDMTSTDQLRWTRVRDRLRAEVGDDIYSSWFARMELEGSEGDTVKLSVPTRFLKSWIQSHYAEKVLTCWQAEDGSFSRIELTVRSSVIRNPPAKNKPAATPA